MNFIIDNIRILWPFLVIPWITLLLLVFLRPQRYTNSIILMGCIGITLMFISGLFGTYMGYAMLAIFILCIIILFLVPILLIANGVQLIRKEGKSLAHLLSLFLGIVVGIGEIATIIYVLNYGEDMNYNKVNFLALFVGFTVFYFSALILAFVLYSVFIQIMPHYPSFDYIIIHGCGLIDGNRVSRLLANRIDKGIKIYNRCKVKPKIIASGGKGSDESLSEAEAMYNYLVEHGIPASDIILEDKSATTMENIENSRKIIKADGKKHRVALVSSNYHIYRCVVYAKKLDMKCVGIGAPVALYYWPSALIREFVAIFTQKKFIILTAIGYLGFAFFVLAPYYFM